MAAHVYDITYGSLVPHVDNLVIIDDSIVRGTTLRQSIIGILDRLHPKKIVIVSSSPQVRYPDYYGIDMASMDQFIAFKAAIDLLKERDMKDVIARAYNKSKDQVGLPKEQMVNYVKKFMPLSLMRRLRQNGGTSHSEGYAGESGNRLSDTGRIA